VADDAIRGHRHRTLTAMGTLPPIDPASPAAIAGASFPTARKGFDQDAVRDLLRRVAAELRDTQDERDRLLRRLDEAHATSSLGPAPLDEATVADLLGEETASVLRSAHEAAALVRSRADENASVRLREIEDESARRRAEIDVEVARLRQETNERAQELKDAALREGREMVAEARAVRERVFADLARRRDLARQQIEELLAGRARLERVFDEARSSVDRVLSDLEQVGPPPEVPDATFTPITGEVPSMVLGEVEVPAFVAAAERVEHDVDETMARHPAHRRAPTVQGEVDVAEGEPGDETEVAPSEPAEGDIDHVDDGAEDAGDSSGAKPTVDDLFAKLREASATSVAEEVLGDDEPGKTDNPGHARSLTATPDQADQRFVERKQALDPIRPKLARQLKRAVDDEQNGVLDRLRRAKSLPSLDDLVGAETEQIKRFREGAADALRDAALAGVQAIRPVKPAAAERLLDGTNVLDRCLAEVDAEVVQPLRQRLGAALAAAGDDPVDATGLLRAVYREWKVDRLDGASEHLALSAHGRGAFVALAPGTPVCWVADPEGPGCPDAEDNWLAGAVPAGDEFPTGHRHTPAYPGCRCLVAPVQQ
jgi:cell division septum initiation protein DivIVA